MRAIIAMNINCILGAVMLTTFKQIQLEGVFVFDFAFFRNAFNFCFTCLLHKLWNIDPWKDFPHDQKWYLFARSTIGNLSFVLYTFTLILLPFLYLQLIVQTTPFWASIMGSYLNGDVV